MKLDDLPIRYRTQVFDALAARILDPKLKQTNRRKPVGDEKAPGKSSGSVIVIITRCATRSLDRDNLWGGAKATVDSLRYSGHISGDTEQEIELFVFQKKVPKEKIGTLIEILQLP